MADKPNLKNLEQDLADKGKLIEAGWISLRLAAVPDDAPEIQLEEMRNAFFAGAQHLFSSIMEMLDPGDDVADADLDRMGLIEAELDAFIKDYSARHGLDRPATH